MLCVRSCCTSPNRNQTHMPDLMTPFSVNTLTIVIIFAVQELKVNNAHRTMSIGCKRYLGGNNLCVELVR